MRASLFLGTLLAAPAALATQPPSMLGMNVTWHDSFEGCTGCSVNGDAWEHILHIDVNNELQTYTKSNQNVQLSGGSTLQIVPWKNKDGSWSSARLEAKNAFTPKPGKKTRWQASIRMGDGASRQGMWPAFWLLGDSIRHGTEWPLCGELDIMEQVNGAMEGFGSIHCGDEFGGVCNEPTGIQGSVHIPNNDFHEWALEVDRTTGDWQTETITWMMDGYPFQTVTGAALGDGPTWSTLAHSPFYMIVNVAVGGAWPGDPTAATQDGYDNMMEVEYTAIYESL